MLHDTLTGLLERINENPLAFWAAELCGCGPVSRGTSAVSRLELPLTQEDVHRKLASAGLGSQGLH